MKIKHSRTLAIILSLILAATPAVTDTTAAKAAQKVTKLSVKSSGSKNVKSGQKRTIIIKGTNAQKASWSVSGTGKKYIKLSEKTGKKISFTVKKNATGKAKITAKVAKTDNKKGNSVSVSYNLSCDPTAISLDDKELFVGETATLKLSTKPSNAKLSGTVEFKAYTDPACSTESSDVTITPGKTSCKFKASKIGTYYVKAVCGNMSCSAKISVTDFFVNLSSAKQTKTNELLVEFDGDSSTVAAADMKVINGDGVVLDVKSVVPDKDDDTKAVVTTFNAMKDGRENTLSYGDSTVTFMATNGIAATLTVTPKTAPINTKVPIEIELLDVNNVQLEKYKYGSESEKYLIETEGEITPDQDSGTIVFDTIGQKTDVTVTYNTGVVDSNGANETMKTKITIQAIAEGRIASVENIKYYKSTDSQDTPMSGADLEFFEKNMPEKLKDNPRLDGTGNISYYMMGIIKDEYGYRKADGSIAEAGYILEPSDDGMLYIGDGKMMGIRDGSLKVYLKNDKGDILYSVPVEIEALPKLSSFSLSTRNISLSTGNIALPGKGADTNGWTAKEFVSDYRRVYISAKDQYGDSYSGANIKIIPDNSGNIEECLEMFPGDTPFANGAPTDMLTLEKDHLFVSEMVVRVKSPIPNTDGGDKNKKRGVDYIKPGSPVRNSYKIELTDVNDEDLKVSQKMDVAVAGASTSGTSLSLVAYDRYNNSDGSKVDPALANKGGDNGTKLVQFRLAVKDRYGTLVCYALLPSLANIELHKGSVSMKNDKNMYVLQNDSVSGWTNEWHGIDGNKYVTPGGFGVVTCAATSIVNEQGNFTRWSEVSKNAGDDAVYCIELMARNRPEWDVRGSLLGGSIYNGKLSVAEPAEDGVYTVHVKGLGISNGFVQYDKKGVYSASVDVKSTQVGIYAELSQKNVTDAGDDPAMVAARAFSIKAGDTENYVYNSEKTTPADAKSGYIIAIPNKESAGYEKLGNTISYKRLRVYVPYKNGGSAGTDVNDYTYLCREINVSKAVNIE